MNRGRTGVITTACVGMAIGTAAYMMAGNKGKTKKIKKVPAGRCARLGTLWMMFPT